MLSSMMSVEEAFVAHEIAVFAVTWRAPSPHLLRVSRTCVFAP
jgi:hypothetical protein